jgi:hypothetical protein
MRFGASHAPAMRVLVVVPTTGGPLIVRGLKARAGLPTSAAFADGDYRPLPWSGDYARLTGAGGPLARASGSGTAGSTAYELRLSRSFDAGRSWEAPVALAHMLIAAGHTITDEPEQAQLVLWATGAVDLDLRLIPGDYALLDKIEGSRELFARASNAPIACLLPPGGDHAAAAALLAELGRTRAVRLLSAGAIPAAAAELFASANGGAAAAAKRGEIPASGPRASFGWLAAGLAATAAAAAGVVLFVLVMQAPAEQPPETDQNQAVSEPKPEEKVAVAPPEPAQKAPPEPPPLTLQELRAPAGRSCRQVLFAAAQPERHPVPLEGDRFAPSRLDKTLCGLAIRARDPRAMVVEASSALTAISLPPNQISDGSQILYLRDNLHQNAVYTLQVFAQEGSARRPLGLFTHELTQ